MAFLIGVDGVVIESRIVKSSGFPLLDIAAQEGVARCKFTPGKINDKAEPSWANMQYVWTLGDSTAQDTAAELAQARAGAERGDPQAAYRLGAIMMDKSSPAYNPADGRAWWRKAAEQGHARAQLSMGGIAQGGADAGQAVGWFRKAAEQGLSEAQHVLAITLAASSRADDNSAALDWLQRAAAQGYTRSQAHLA
jgi:hypothetical protein